MIDLILSFLAGGVADLLASSDAAGGTDRSSDAVYDSATTYRRWAKKHRLRTDGSVYGYRGTIARHEVVVAPGFQATPPLLVRVEIAIDHGRNAAAVLRSPSDGSTEVETALSAMLSVPSFTDVLRSIAVTERGITLRFTALTSPDLIERGILQAVETVASVVTVAAARTAYR